MVTNLARDDLNIGKLDVELLNFDNPAYDFDHVANMESFCHPWLS